MLDNRRDRANSCGQFGNEVFDIAPEPRHGQILFPESDLRIPSEPLPEGAVVPKPHQSLGHGSGIFQRYDQTVDFVLHNFRNSPDVG